MDDLKNVKTSVLEARLAKVTTQREGLAYLVKHIEMLDLTSGYVLAQLRRDLRDEAQDITAELAIRDARGLRTPLVPAPERTAVSHVLA